MAAIIFVEIVAAMDDQVDIVARGGMAIGVEIAKGQVGAGKETDAEAGYVPLRQGAGAADPADPAIGGDEAVEIPLARLKAGNGYFRGVIGIGAGRDFAARHDLCKGRVGRDLDAQLAVARPDITGPQQHAIRARLATGDAMGEAAQAQYLRNAGNGQGGQPHDAGLDKQAAVDGEAHGGSFPAAVQKRPVSCAP